MSQPFLVVGQGLAGTAVAWRLWERGVPFVVVDRDEPVTSSKVAAGLMTPITGMRLNLNWRYDSLYPEALAFYRKFGWKLGRPFLFPRRLVRYFRDDAARDVFEKRLVDPVYRRFVAGRADPDPRFASESGGFVQRHAAYLDTAVWLGASRTFFCDHDAWVGAEISAGDLEVRDDSVVWRGRFFENVIFCTGWQAAHHPWFDWVPFTSARGTILQIDSDLGGLRRIVNRGAWVLPRADGTLRAGASYEPRFDEPNVPGEAALEELRRKLGVLLKSGYSEVEAQTAVRPLVGRKNALMGRHPAFDRVCFLNALGSKGALRSPWAARVLVEHLLDGSPLESEVDLRQNLP